MRTVDLFCGCGGMSLGFKDAGFEIIAGYDNWEAAINIYSKNFANPVYKMDLLSDEAVEQIKKDNPDIIIGGPPCQDFSIAGKRNIGNRANLTIRFAEIIENVKPKWFVMENVYSIEKTNILSEATRKFKQMGYGLTCRILDASYYGVPQKRKRFFMVGRLKDDDNFLGTYLDNMASKKQMTVYDYLGNSLGTEYYYMHPRSYKRRAVFSIYEPSSTIRGINRPIPKGYKGHPGDKAKITDGVRPLTAKERSYLQTFPKTYILDGNKKDVEQAIGNAVPVKLAECVGLCIIDYEKKAKNG